MDTKIYLVGGTSAVMEGWRETTKDIDIAIRPESDALLRLIPSLKETLRVNVELASPDQFIPALPGWEERSPVVERLGRVTVLHYDFVSQALAKVERGLARDLEDVHEMLNRGLVTPAQLRAQFEAIVPQMYRFPAVDVPSFRRALDDALREAP